MLVLKWFNQESLEMELSFKELLNDSDSEMSVGEVEINDQGRN